MAEKSIFLPAVGGGSLVLAIFAFNYLLSSNYDQKMIDEAMQAVHAATTPDAAISAVKFPHASYGSRDRANPWLLCGYVDGRRFQYEVHQRHLTIDDQPGTACNPALYP